MFDLPAPRGPTRLAAWLASAAVAASLLISQGAVAQTALSPLNLDDALRRAARFDPSRPAAEAHQAAGEAAIRQANVKPNPSLGLELENFAGTGAYSVLDRTEATLSYQQTLERGGKREARTGLARAQLEATRLRAQVRRLDLLRDVETAYAEALAAEADLLIAEARLVAAQSAQADVNRRVRSARDPLFAGSRAEAIVAQAEIARDEARAAAAASRQTLASYWGGGPDFAVDLKGFFEVAPPAATARASEPPDLPLLIAERDAAAAAVRVEQSRAVSDPTVKAGIRYFGQGDGVAFVVGGSIPLRRYDTNRAAIERAAGERTAAEVEVEAARKVRERQIAGLTARLASAARESERIRTQVVPAAIRAVEQVRSGFNRGGFQYADVADAEKGLFDARARRVAVLRQYHLDLATLDRLLGRHAGLATTAETR